MPIGGDIILKPIWCNKHGRRYLVMKDIKYTNSFGEFVVTKGYITDLASIPKIFRSILPPDGRYLEAAILHDFLYSFAILPRKLCDKVFLEEMSHSNVHSFIKGVIYQSVKIFGKPYYNLNGANGKFC